MKAAAPAVGRILVSLMYSPGARIPLALVQLPSLWNEVAWIESKLGKLSILPANQLELTGTYQERDLCCDQI